MKKGILKRRLGAIAFLALLFVLIITPVAQAQVHLQEDKNITVTLINLVATFLIFVFGIRVTYVTRGGFLSISFILIVTGIMIGWVAKIGFEFLTDSLILATNFNVVGLAETLGGVILAAGFILLSKKLKN